jgi:hypothetical protein
MRAKMTWVDMEINWALDHTSNAEVNADAMLRTLAEIRSLPEIKEES